MHSLPIPLRLFSRRPALSTDFVMIELKVVLTDIAKAIVDEPDKVSVIETVEGDDVTLELHVAEDDMGKVIGRHGKIAKSIRLVMKAAANIVGKRVSVDIR